MEEHVTLITTLKIECFSPYATNCSEIYEYQYNNGEHPS